ncbi:MULTISPECIES: hypothetical protein [Paenibacillus]|uniref:hypothetical protein n=1 Tax=Paenibacillus TaxID=44249 RepID=UPI00096EB91E|nr:hypothetical protein [Paenibacillus amylolyticus]OMF40775.1 hypothetical protein BK136_22305 [Paenibacillus amylolyticus]
MGVIEKRFSGNLLVITEFMDDYFTCKNITPSALTSLTSALKGFFRTYNTLHNFYFNLNNFTEAQEKQLCEFTDYHENYMQAIIHFHHFIELVIKDALRFHNEHLANKLGDSKINEAALLQHLRDGRDIGEIKFKDMSVEYNIALKRALELPNSSIKGILMQHKEALEEINILRNMLLHRGARFLLYRQLDEFVVRTILPLVQDILYKCEELWNGEEIKEYWCYDYENCDIDPIQYLANMPKEGFIDHRAIAFYKAVGLALYQRPLERSLESIYEEDLMRVIYDLKDKSKKTCFVCSYDTLFLYPDIDYSSAHKLNKGKHYFNSCKAVCTKCGLKLYNDVNEPADYGINEDEGRIWEYTHLIEIN